MDRFLLAKNPLHPDSPQYIIDTVTNIWFMITTDEDEVLTHIHGGTPDDVIHSRNRALRWFISVKEKLA